MSKSNRPNIPLSQLFQSRYLRNRFGVAESDASLSKRPDYNLETGLLLAIATEVVDHPKSMPAHLRVTLERILKLRGINIPIE